MGRLLIFIIGLSLAAQEVGNTQAQAPPQKQQTAPEVSDDTLIVGTTTLKLGMPKDDVVRMLSAQYDLKSEFETPKKDIDESIDVWAGKQNLVATVHFDAKGMLEWASKVWTPDTSRHYSDGEIGRVIFTLWATLPTSVGCRLIALKSQDYEGPPYTQSHVKDVIRDAHIECGHKRITFTTLTSKGDESLNITEEIDSKSILQRP
jgi:hypothetical protein